VKGTSAAVTADTVPTKGAVVVGRVVDGALIEGTTVEAAVVEGTVVEDEEGGGLTVRCEPPPPQASDTPARQPRRATPRRPWRDTGTPPR
jgi:hypothetical protein